MAAIARVDGNGKKVLRKMDPIGLSHPPINLNKQQHSTLVNKEHQTTGVQIDKEECADMYKDIEAGTFYTFYTFIPGYKWGAAYWLKHQRIPRQANLTCWTHLIF